MALPNRSAELRHQPVKQVDDGGTVLGFIPEKAHRPAVLFVENESTGGGAAYNLYVNWGLETADVPVGPENYRKKLGPGQLFVIDNPKVGFVKMAIESAAFTDAGNRATAFADWTEQ